MSNELNTKSSDVWNLDMVEDSLVSRLGDVDVNDRASLSEDNILEFESKLEMLQFQRDQRRIGSKGSNKRDTTSFQSQLQEKQLNPINHAIDKDPGFRSMSAKSVHFEDHEGPRSQLITPGSEIIEALDTQSTANSVKSLTGSSSSTIAEPMPSSPFEEKSQTEIKQPEKGSSQSCASEGRQQRIESRARSGSGERKKKGRRRKKSGKKSSGPYIPRRIACNCRHELVHAEPLHPLPSPKPEELDEESLKGWVRCQW